LWRQWDPLAPRDRREIKAFKVCKATPVPPAHKVKPVPRVLLDLRALTPLSPVPPDHKVKRVHREFKVTPVPRGHRVKLVLPALREFKVSRVTQVPQDPRVTRDR
jgi:hypothetical protein